MSMSTVIQLPNLDLACIIGFKFKFCNVVLLNYLELYWYLKSTAFSATFVLKSNTFTVLHYFTPAAKHNEIYVEQEENLLKTFFHNSLKNTPLKV